MNKKRYKLHIKEFINRRELKRIYLVFFYYILNILYLIIVMNYSVSYNVLKGDYNNEAGIIVVTNENFQNPTFVSLCKILNINNGVEG